MMDGVKGTSVWWLVADRPPGSQLSLILPPSLNDFRYQVKGQQLLHCSVLKCREVVN